ncbi:response regulator [Salinibacter ruber]|uniref:response regulator n=1 Tax=Salinibacter ruber TaxID=146919 RepID=UPI002169477F|nr:response regulator [Salinibacter ruber]MCS3698360.1 CheY-like chemotaxis protein [Salinibacter ruber]
MGQTDLPSILLVDDDPQMPFLLEEMVEGTFEVVSASSAEEALSLLSERFSEQLPDLFLLDIRLPGGRSGVELLHLLRDFGLAGNSGLADNSGLAGEVPAVALTTHAGPEKRAALLAEGFDEHVSKPFFREELFEALRRALPHGVLPHGDAHESGPSWS